MNLPNLSHIAGWLQAALGEPLPNRLPVGGDRASAVLVAVLIRSRGPTVLLVRKASNLQRHAGQLGFPGGGVEAGDVSSEAAALREAWEEVGLSADRVEIVGALDDERTFVTGYHIRPVVALVRDPPPEWHLDTGEIDAVCEIDLAEVIARDPASWIEFDWPDGTHRVPRFEFPEGVVVWGASGRMLLNLQRRLRAVASVKV